MVYRLRSRLCKLQKRFTDCLLMLFVIVQLSSISQCNLNVSVDLQSRFKQHLRLNIMFELKDFMLN